MLYLVCNGADVNTEEARKEKITAIYQIGISRWIYRSLQHVNLTWHYVLKFIEGSLLQLC